RLVVDFGIAEVAAGIGSPDGAALGGGACAESAAADIEPAATRTAALHEHAARLIVQLAECAGFPQFLCRRGVLFLPDRGERRAFDVAEIHGLPELVGMHVALGVDVGETAAGAVVAAAVPFQQTMSRLQTGVVFPFHPQ